MVLRRDVGDDPVGRLPRRARADHPFRAVNERLARQAKHSRAGASGQRRVVGIVCNVILERRLVPGQVAVEIDLVAQKLRTPRPGQLDPIRLNAAHALVERLRSAHLARQRRRKALDPVVERGVVGRNRPVDFTTRGARADLEVLRLLRLRRGNERRRVGDRREDVVRSPRQSIVLRVRGEQLLAVGGVVDSSHHRQEIVFVRFFDELRTKPRNASSAAHKIEVVEPAIAVYRIVDLQRLDAHFDVQLVFQQADRVLHEQLRRLPGRFVLPPEVHDLVEQNAARLDAALMVHTSREPAVVVVFEPHTCLKRVVGDLILALDHHTIARATHIGHPKSDATRRRHGEAGLALPQVAAIKRCRAVRITIRLRRGAPAILVLVIRGGGDRRVIANRRVERQTVERIRPHVDAVLIPVGDRRVRIARHVVPNHVAKRPRRLRVAVTTVAPGSLRRIKRARGAVILRLREARRVVVVEIVRDPFEAHKRPIPQVHLDLGLRVLAIDVTAAAPLVAVQLRPARIGRNRPQLSAIHFDKRAVEVVVSERLRNRRAKLIARIDREILDDRTQRRIRRLRNIARARRGHHRAQILVIDIPEHRAAAERIGPAQRNPVQHKSNLLQVEGPHSH